MIALLLAAALAPAPVTDLRAAATVAQTGIQWACTIPALNDSACGPDEWGEIVCAKPPRYAPATDSVMYHWIVIGLPPPYVRQLEDSAKVARLDRVTKFYQSWPLPWVRVGHVTQHWLSRRPAPPMSDRYNPGARRGLYVRIKSR